MYIAIFELHTTYWTKWFLKNLFFSFLFLLDVVVALIEETKAVISVESFCVMIARDRAS